MLRPSRGGCAHVPSTNQWGEPMQLAAAAAASAHAVVLTNRRLVTGREAAATTRGPAALCALTAAQYYAAQPLYRLSPDGSVVVQHCAAARHASAPYARVPLADAAGGASSGPAATPGRVAVRFEVPQYVTSFGEFLRVVGSATELGAWDTVQAPAMAWEEGHSWSLDVALQPGQDIVFKVVREDGSGKVLWEEGGDRTAALPLAGSAAGVVIECPWGRTDAMTVTVTPITAEATTAVLDAALPAAGEPEGAAVAARPEPVLVEVAAADTTVLTPCSAPDHAVSHLVASKEVVAHVDDGWVVSEVPSMSPTVVAALTVLAASEEGKADTLLAVFGKIRATAAACLALTAEMAQRRGSVLSAEASPHGVIAARASALAAVAAMMSSSSADS